MKRRKYDGADVRKILIGMVTDRAVCARITTQWLPEGLFDADYANRIGFWCVKHHRQYGVPPNGQLTTIFEDWASNGGADEKEVNLIENFLQALSDEQAQEEPESSEFVLDLAGRYFNSVRARRAMDLTRQEFDRGRIDEGLEELDKLRRVQLGPGSYVCPADDESVCIAALTEERERSLIRYRGALSEFFGTTLARGTLFAFLALDKSGKTSHLIDFTYSAVRNRNRVAFFDTGDGSRDEVVRSLLCRASWTAEHAGEYDKPIGWDDEGWPVHETIKVPRVDALRAQRALRKICKGKDVLRVAAYPSGTISAEGIDNQLSDWEREHDWRPDVVVIDYADLLAPINTRQDINEQIDETWKRLRRISQARHCLVMTATQASAAAYRKRLSGLLLGPGDFSGRKTKNAHVNGIIGINITQEEYDRGRCRWNWVVRRKKTRKGELKHPFVTVAGCFGIGCTTLLSRWEE